METQEQHKHGGPGFCQQLSASASKCVRDALPLLHQRSSLHVCARHTPKVASRVKKLHGRARPQDARTHQSCTRAADAPHRSSGFPRGGEVGQHPCPCAPRPFGAVPKLGARREKNATPFAAAPTADRRHASFRPHRRARVGRSRVVGAGGLLAWQRTAAAAGSRRISSRPADRELLPRGATVRQAD